MKKIASEESELRGLKLRQSSELGNVKRWNWVLQNRASCSNAATYLFGALLRADHWAEKLAQYAHLGILTLYPTVVKLFTPSQRARRCGLYPTALFTTELVMFRESDISAFIHVVVRSMARSVPTFGPLHLPMSPSNHKCSFYPLTPVVLVYHVKADPSRSQNLLTLIFQSPILLHGRTMG